MSALFAIIVVILQSVLIVPFVILSIFFYKNICCNSNDENTVSNKKITILSIIIFSFYFIGTIVLLTLHIYFIIIDEYDLRISIPTLGISYGIGLILTPLMFTLRIHYTFIGELSIFAYSILTIKLLYILFIIDMILFLLSAITMAFLSNTSSILAAVWILCYIINYIILIILFFKRVFVMIRYKVNKDKNDKNDIEMKEKETTEINKFKDNNNNSAAVIKITSINLLVRFSLLILLSFSTTILYLLVGGVESQIKAKNGEFKDEINAGSLFAIIDCTVNAICICLLFQFSSNLYYKLCLYYDQCLKHCMVSKIFNNKDEKQEFKRLLSQK